MITDDPWGSAPQRKTLVNAGCGPRAESPRSPMFRDWLHIRVDVDPTVEPDIVADITDLSPIRDSYANAVWSSHCLEHLFLHQVPSAFLEFHRILADDGFMICLVPDIQAVAGMVAADKPLEPIYQAPAGPVTAHDMFYGFGPALASGRSQMAHRCGLTPSILVTFLQQSPFAESAIRRLSNLELAIVARKTNGNPSNNCESLLQTLAL